MRVVAVRAGGTVKVADERIHIVSNNEEPFADRVSAGRLLAEELAYLKGRNPVVLGVPRGGMVVAGELARRTYADLDIVLARKLRAPLNRVPAASSGMASTGGVVFF